MTTPTMLGDGIRAESRPVSRPVSGPVSRQSAPVGDSLSLADLRAQIEAVDARLIATLAERVVLARAAGHAKVLAHHPVVDPAREAAVVTRAVVLARAAGLVEDDVRALYWRIMAMSRRVQLAGDAATAV